MPRETRDEVRVDMSGRNKASASRSSAFVYVNDGFTGSVNSVAENRVTAPAPDTGVYREQYCVCARWPYTQRALAVTVGVLLGALIGLALSIAFKGNNDPVLGNIFNSRSVPD